MKGANFKALLVILSISSSVVFMSTVEASSKDAVSCGRTTASQNDLEEEIMTSLPDVKNELIEVDSVKKELADMIENYSVDFGNGVISENGKTWNDIATTHPDLNYKYSSNDNRSECKNSVMWGIIFYTTCTPSSSAETAIVAIKHKEVDAEVRKKDFLKLVADSTSVVKNGTIYYLTDKKGGITVLDNRYPLQANPAAIRHDSGKTIIFIKAE